MKIKKTYVNIAIIDCILFVLLLLLGLEITFGLALIVWINLLVYSVMDIQERGIFFGFLICFFTFLMGRQALEYFGLHDVETIFPDIIEAKTDFLILMALIGVFLGYIIFSNVKFRDRNKLLNSGGVNDSLIQTVKKVSKICFIISFPFALLTLAEQIVFVNTMGYYASYVAYSSQLPGVVLRLGSMNKIFFFLFLGCLPSKKETSFPIVLYGIYLISILFTGHRYDCIGGILILVVYYILRNKLSNEEEKWIGRKEVLILAIGAGVLVVVANIVAVTRFGGNASVSSSGFLTEFLYQQGVSIKVIKRYLEYKSSLPSGKLYFLGSTLSYLSQSIPGRLIGMATYGGNSVETARNGYYLAHALSYQAMGNQYLSGAGMGSSYIAEIHYSFGSIGVFLGSILYGVMLKKMFVLRESHVWWNAAVLVMLNAVFFSPRSSFDGFLGDLINVNTWGTFLIVFIVSSLLHSNYSGKSVHQ